MTFECDRCGHEGRPRNDDVTVYSEYDEDGNLVGEPAYCDDCADQMGLRDSSPTSAGDER